MSAALIVFLTILGFIIGIACCAVGVVVGINWALYKIKWF